jgi:ATP-dependent Clp protease ATP-binding subunit ClpA
LLYALSREGKGLAGAVLDRLAVTPEALQAQLVEDSAAHDRIDQGTIDLADEARDAIERAVAAAQEWNHRVLDTEHLLYGILAAPTSADDLLAALRITPEQVLKQIQILQREAPPPIVRDELTHAYRLTVESAWVLSLATDFARRHNAHQVTSLHLLAALITLPGLPRDALVGQLGLDERRLEARLGRSRLSHATGGRLPLAEEVQRGLGYAIGEAWNRGHRAVAPIHLAMGLAHGSRHSALEALADLGISHSDLVETLEAFMPPPVYPKPGR